MLRFGAIPLHVSGPCWHTEKSTILTLHPHHFYNPTKSPDPGQGKFAMKILLKHDILCFRPDDGHDQHDLNSLDRFCECAIKRDEHGAPLLAAVKIQRKNQDDLDSSKLAARRPGDAGVPPMRLRVYERGEISIVPRTMREHEFANLLARSINSTRTANTLNVVGLSKKTIPLGKIAVWEAAPETCVNPGAKPVLAGVDTTGGVIRCVAKGRRHAAELINQIGGTISANKIRDYWEQKYAEAHNDGLETGVWLMRKGTHKRLV